MDNEAQFVNIKGYENIYKINKLGQVYSVKSNRVLKPIKKSNGYLFVNLYKGKDVKAIYVHKLMADTFLHKVDNGYVVNHKDLNKENNRLDNLELVTQKENIYHSKINGRQVRKISSSNTKSKKVLQYDINHNLIKVWDSVMDIQRQLGIKSNYVSNCALGKCKTSKGYIWKYKK